MGGHCSLYCYPRYVFILVMRAKQEPNHLASNVYKERGKQC